MSQPNSYVIVYIKYGQKVEERFHCYNMMMKRYSFLKAGGFNPDWHLEK